MNQPFKADNWKEIYYDCLKLCISLNKIKWIITKKQNFAHKHDLIKHNFCVTLSECEIMLHRIYYLLFIFDN